ncbi:MULTISPECIES: ATP-grasp domain-containing protein [Bacillus]|nr:MULTISPECIES: ATP-grasp domain-containing protein [Bacillus]EJV74924.1 hypothetical protein IGE_05462 [Bacillus cereus HuB1-1]HDX9688682.1 ATP-grasp domain-containing protein [Bacillus thuringiensis]
MNKKTIILVESGNFGMEIVELHNLDYNVIFLSTGILPFDTSMNKYILKHIEDRSIVKLNYLESIIKELLRGYNVISIFTTSDFFIYPVSIICEKFNFNTLNSTSAEIFSNKFNFRFNQQSKGFLHPEFYKFSNLNDGMALINKNRHKKWVFKPIMGNESIGVKLITSSKDLKECYQANKNLARYTNNLFSQDYMLEEYITGEIYSCEFITSKHGLHILGITNRHITPPPFFVELEYCFPFQDHLTCELYRETEKFVRNFNYDFGPCHLEFIVTKENYIYILEVNPRIMGWPNNWLIDRALDCNIFREIANLYITGKINIKTNFYNNFTCCLEVTTPSNGYLVSIDVNRDWSNHKNIKVIQNVKEGTYIKTASSNKDILLRILTVGATTSEAIRLAQEVQDSYQLNIV